MHAPKNALQGCLSAHRVPLKTKRVAEEVLLKFLLPHKLFACLFQSLLDAFKSSLLGGDASNISTFWKAMKKHPIVTSAPELQNRSVLGKLVRLAIHGDGVSYIQVGRASGKSADVLSWSSLLSKGPTRVSSFLVFALPKTVIKDSGFNLTCNKVWKVLPGALRPCPQGCGLPKIGTVMKHGQLAHSEMVET